MSLKQNILSAYRLMQFVRSERAWRSLNAKANFKVENKIEAKNILVVSAHPDDEIFGCGGTLIENCESKISIIYLFAGDKNSKSELALERKEESKRAGRILAKERAVKSNSEKIEAIEQKFFNLADNSVISKTVTTEICEIISSYKPNAIFVPNFSDPHIDHRSTAEAITKALSEKIPHQVRDDIQVYLYEIWSPLPHFNRLIEIDMEKKIIVMNAFKTQKKERDYVSAIEYLNSYRGKIFGLKNPAEAFFALPADLFVKIFVR